MGVTKVFINLDSIVKRKRAGARGVVHFGGVITTPPTLNSDTVFAIKIRGVISNPLLR